MTKENAFIASRQESEARSVVAQLGLSRELKGTYIIQDFVVGKKKTEMLNDSEIEMVIDSWQTRNYVPIALINQQEHMQSRIDNLIMITVEKETEIEYKRRKVKLIEKYVKTIRA